MAILLKIRSCYGNATGVQNVVESYKFDHMSEWAPTTALSVGQLAALGIRKDYAPPRAVADKWFDWAKVYKDHAGEGIPVDEIVRHKAQVNEVTWEPVDHFDSNHGCRQYQVWTVREGLPYSFDLDMPVSCVRQKEFSVDLKWSLWAGERGMWEEYGHGLVLSALEYMSEGDTVTIKLAAWKEVRYGTVSITFVKVLDTGVGKWRVAGDMTEGWDEVYDLFNTFGLYDLSQDAGDEKVLEQLGIAYEDRFEPENLERINAKLKELGYHGGANDVDAFTEMIPFSHRLYDPGVDHEFEFEFEGTLDELLVRIDQEEDALIKESAEEWDTIERSFKEEA